FPERTVRTACRSLSPFAGRPRRRTATAPKVPALTTADGSLSMDKRARGLLGYDWGGWPLLIRDWQVARLATTHREVFEAFACQTIGVIQVTPVEDHRGFEPLLDQLEIRRLELLPFGADDQGICAH